MTLAMGYGYDAAGRLGNVQLPSGNNVAFGYNANGQVTSLTLNGSASILSGVTYDPFGPITGWTWGNGTFASRGFDTDGKITQVDNANGASLKNYAYDDAFRITGITDAGNNALSWTYGYDSLDRLTAANSPSVTQGWSYDANGNRLTETGSTPSTYANSGTSNRVNSISGSLPRTYGYDAAGNSLSFGTATFTYNNRGRMATATNGGVSASYLYNALGQRIRRMASGISTLYVFDGAGHLAGEYSAAGALIQETVWLGDTPVATLRPDGSGGVVLFFVHADHLNTPRLITDTSNNIRWRWDSGPFGTNYPDEDPSSLGVFQYSLRFPGQQFDAIVGLHYNYFRDYDPAVGRYVQSDPIGLAGGVNTYAYVRGNPVIKSDPFGLCECAPGAGRFQTQTAAARAAIQRAMPETIQRDVEFCGSVCKDRSTGKYFTTGPVRGGQTSCSRASAPCPATCSTWVAVWHTHGAQLDGGGERFSDADMNFSDKNRVDNYMGTPKGQFMHYPANGGPPYDRGKL